MNKKRMFFTFVFICFLFLLSLKSGVCSTIASDQIIVDDDNIQGPWEGTMDNPYRTIQSALNSSTNGSYIYVFNGSYDENLIISKNITIVGEDKDNTIIQGYNFSDTILLNDKGDTTIACFTIKNTGSNSGIKILSNNNNIVYNNILGNERGIYVRHGDNNNISRNNISSNNLYGIHIYHGEDSKIYDNILLSNRYACRIQSSYDNTIFYNYFSKNDYGIYFCCGATDNIAYYNTFVDNNYWNANDYVGGNIWYKQDENKGNYWDDYQGSDKNNDGIGDISYNITYDGTKNDPYPLMNPTKSNELPDCPDKYNLYNDDNDDEENNTKNESLDDGNNTEDKNKDKGIPGFGITILIITLIVISVYKKRKKVF